MPSFRPVFLLSWLIASPSIAAALDILPPAPAWHGASEALVVKPDHPWITPSEKTGLTDSPNYDETLAYLTRLSQASPLIKLVTFGQTAQGRDLYVVVASKEGANNPDALQKSGKPSLLAQAGIHSGEIDGKDAGLMLLRDIAFGGKAALLDKANFLLVPIFNADGHERSSEFNRPNQRGPVHQGWRTTAQNLNLNRDYMKVDSPEMQSMLDLINAWSPALYLDLHVTDGVDYQYDITFGFNGENGDFAWSPKTAAWLDSVFKPIAYAALEKQGHIPGPLVTATNNRDLAQGITGGVTPPRYSNGYGDLRHIASMLVENHSLKSYKQRVLGTYVLLEACLQVLSAHGTELQAAIGADEDARPAKLQMNWTTKDAPTAEVDFKGIAYEEYLSPVSGANEVRWLGTPKLFPKLKVQLARSDVTVARPKAYYVPVTKPEVIDRLRAHGIALEELDEPKTVTVEMDRLVAPKAATEPFEGHYPLTISGVTRESRKETFPSGSVRVPTDQPLGDLAITLLEPESDESLLAWGFFYEILQRTEYIEGYAIEPLARQMLAADPKLKTEFEQKLKTDAAFARDSEARLRWFYERSPFSDERYLLYPVGIER